MLIVRRTYYRRPSGRLRLSYYMSSYVRYKCSIVRLLNAMSIQQKPISVNICADEARTFSFYTHGQLNLQIGTDFE